MLEERGIIFDSIHSGIEWGLLLTVCNKGTPEPKSNFVSVEGRDGDLDLSEALTGEIKFNDRTDEYGFNFLDGTRQERQILMDKVCGFLHGRKRNIILPDWPDYYSVGRITVTDRKNYMGYGEMSLQAVCEPWLYKRIPTTVVKVLTDTDQEIICLNSGVKTVIPEIQTTGQTTVTFGDYTTTVNQGTHKLLDISFPSGTNIIKARGTGTITLTWTEGIV